MNRSRLGDNNESGFREVKPGCLRDTQVRLSGGHMNISGVSLGLASEVVLATLLSHWCQTIRDGGDVSRAEGQGLSGWSIPALNG